jgi:hypothetical protein
MNAQKAFHRIGHFAKTRIGRVINDVQWLLSTLERVISASWQRINGGARRLLGLHLFRPWKPARISLAARQLAEERLKRTPALQTAETAETILQQVMLVVDRAVEGNRNLETKSTGVIVLSTALIGFAITFASAHNIPNVPIGIAAMACLALAVVLAGTVNAVETHDLPSPITYNLPSIANELNNNAKIKMELAEAWNDYAIDEGTSGIIKARWLSASFAFMYLGIALFVTVGAIAMSGRVVNHDHVQPSSNASSRWCNSANRCDILNVHHERPSILRK